MTTTRMLAAAALVALTVPPVAATLAATPPTVRRVPVAPATADVRAALLAPPRPAARPDPTPDDLDRLLIARAARPTVPHVVPEPKRPPVVEAPAPPPHSHPPATPAGSVWDRLAACESNGEWDYGPHSGWGSGIYEGGVQFHPTTWDAYKPAGYPDAAYQASREQQIAVAERVLAAQGWGAWPDCSRRLGLR